jgi:hypothetical protein
MLGLKPQYGFDGFYSSALKGGVIGLSMESLEVYEKVGDKAPVIE